MKYSRAQAKRDLPTRENRDNKTRGGKTLVIAGSEGMWGAAILAATAAMRSGAGYVYLFKSKKSPLPLKTPDFLTVKNPKDFEKFKAMAIGPGLSGESDIRSWLKKIKNHPHVVVDASALPVLAKAKIKIPSTWVLTPHEGEMAKLLGVSAKTVKSDRKASLLAAQKKFGCIVLLKGHRTLIADGKTFLEIQSGNPALAKAGTGDVLTGMITGFLSQGLEPIKAAAVAAYTHGFMADRWVKSGNDVLSMLASDLLSLLPQTLRLVRGTRR